MNPISNTAFYCCGVRMEDAQRKRSICSDNYAQYFMDERGLEIFEPFKSEKMPNISNITRCKIIDDLLASEIRQNDGAQIITIGAGFDSRPYRLNGGEWIELDEPQIIDYKNEKLPQGECSNPLQRISIDFSSETLSDKLECIDSERHIIIVIEGVFMYLEPDVIDHMLKALQRLFPRHVLLCDLMTRKFFEKFAQRIHAKLVAAGGQFTSRPDNPKEIFYKNDYQEAECVSTFKRARELGALWDQAKIPPLISWLLINVVMTDLNGYSVQRFKYG